MRATGAHASVVRKAESNHVATGKVPNQRDLDVGKLRRDRTMQRFVIHLLVAMRQDVAQPNDLSPGHNR